MRALLLAFLLLGCHPQPPAVCPATLPPPMLEDRCPKMRTAEGQQCVTCGHYGVYSCVDPVGNNYCVAKGIGCWDSACSKH